MYGAHFLTASARIAVTHCERLSVIIEENWSCSAFSGICTLGAAVPTSAQLMKAPLSIWPSHACQRALVEYGTGKGSSNAIITVGSVVQSVKRYKCALRNPGIDRVSHQRKTRK